MLHKHSHKFTQHKCPWLLELISKYQFLIIYSLSNWIHSLCSNVSDSQTTWSIYPIAYHPYRNLCILTSATSFNIKSQIWPHIPSLGMQTNTFSSNWCWQSIPHYCVRVIIAIEHLKCKQYPKPLIHSCDKLMCIIYYMQRRTIWLFGQCVTT